MILPYAAYADIVEKVVADRGDDLGLLVLADRLDDDADPRATLLRHLVEIRRAPAAAPPRDACAVRSGWPPDDPFKDFPRADGRADGWPGLLAACVVAEDAIGCWGHGWPDSAPSYDDLLRYLARRELYACRLLTPHQRDADTPDVRQGVERLTWTYLVAPVRTAFRGLLRWTGSRSGNPVLSTAMAADALFGSEAASHYRRAVTEGRYGYSWGRRHVVMRAAAAVWAAEEREVWRAYRAVDEALKAADIRLSDPVSARRARYNERRRRPPAGA